MVEKTYWKRYKAAEKDINNLEKVKKGQIGGSEERKAKLFEEKYGVK